jgi:hypothetical protein
MKDLYYYKNGVKESISHSKNNTNQDLKKKKKKKKVRARETHKSMHVAQSTMQKRYLLD